MVIWLTGLSGSGKTTLSNALRDILKPDWPQLVQLDGDVIRETFGGNLGYKEPDRVVQISRMQRLAKSLADQDMLVIVAGLYANADLLSWNRAHHNPYFEVYLKASMKLLAARDSKGLYANAARGEMPDVVGVDIPWHAPTEPHMVVDADVPESPEHIARRIIAAIPWLDSKGNN